MLPMPLIVPLGDRSLLIRFAETLDDEANRAGIAFARRLAADPPPGVVEIVPNLVSVHLRYDPLRTGFTELSGEMRLRLALMEDTPEPETEPMTIPIRYGGEEGPDLAEVARESGLSKPAFIKKHGATPLRVLAIGFSPGFAYCGFHANLPVLPRRGEVRPRVPAGTVLYAAGQTALTATSIPTGWHVIGRTDFINFNPGTAPPLRLFAGDTVSFVSA